LLSVSLFNNGCGISENTALKEVSLNEISMNGDKHIDSIGGNKREINKKYKIVPRIKVFISGGAAGYFSPQFDIVNKGFKKNKDELLKNLGSDDTLLNILSVFALEKKGIIDDRITSEKQRITNMDAILEYQFCCTVHEVYLFSELFDSTSNGDLKDLIYRYIK
jgi:hypothetical protein